MQAVLHYESYSGVQNHAAVYIHRPPLRSTMRAPTASVDPAVYMPPPLRHGAVGCEGQGRGGHWLLGGKGWGDLICLSWSQSPIAPGQPQVVPRVGQGVGEVWDRALHALTRATGSQCQRYALLFTFCGAVMA